MSRAGRTLLIVGVVLGAAPSASAQLGPGDTHGLPCRPTIACTADIVVPGAVEIEAGYITRDLGGVRQLSFPFLVKLSLSRWLQLQVGSNGFTSLAAAPALRYFDNVGTGAKVHFVDQGAYLPSVSVSATASLPAASQDGLPLDENLLFTAYLTKDIGSVHVDFNAGVNVWRVNAGALPQEWFAVALSTSLPPPFGLAVENCYFTDASPAASRDGGTLFALTTPKAMAHLRCGGGMRLFPRDTRVQRVLRDDDHPVRLVAMTVIPLVLRKSCVGRISVLGFPASCIVESRLRLDRRRLIQCLLVGSAASLFGRGAGADEVSVPVSRQAELLVRVAAYDRNLPARAGGTSGSSS